MRRDDNLTPTTAMRPTDTGRHHRTNQWDYKGRGIYHITLATEGRQPIFGSLAGDSEHEAHIVHTSLGKYVYSTFLGLPSFYATRGIKLQVIVARVMPDHMHGVIYVQEPMPKSIGEVVRSFKSACTSWFKREVYLNPSVHEAELVGFCRIFATRNSIWQHDIAGYHERILHYKGQLAHMIQYVKDNPRRLWLKRHNPDMFKMRRGISWKFTDENRACHAWPFSAMGNIFLMDYPHKQHIQCSRSMTPAQLEQQCEAWLHNARQGTVSITSGISDGEKTVARRLLEAGMPLVVMLKDGFPASGSPQERYFKPGGGYFDACADGRLLLIEPDPTVLDDPLIKEAVYRKSSMAPRESLRYHFLALNTIAQTLITATSGKNAGE